ncbi:hypothetical protein [Aliamphritea spongicola]|uniref:hypothetical protein n=1 Tax=Aliamphritea spongicola TaxID=707589 RepID=UPI00196B761A|nr:hypothetical protein [Aliamphritea spongicola]MBN3564118.1 hypothetical protein [Aliamphritea spongicola]
MTQVIKHWTPEQLRQMNEQAFLLDLLDMIKISPTTDESDSSLAALQIQLATIEAMIADRLD